MARLQDDVRGRLQRAALDLFRAQGFERTTAAEIAAEAGVTERTFFRHFADKREVLFDGEAVLRDALTAALADAPDAEGPMAMLFHAFDAVTPVLEANRPFSEPWHQLVSTTPALHERSLAKTAALTDALTMSLQARGVPEHRAALAARAGMASFVYATLAWLEDPKLPLAERLDLVQRELKALVRAD